MQGVSTILRKFFEILTLKKITCYSMTKNLNWFWWITKAA
jgi:hypothetical protein